LACFAWASVFLYELLVRPRRWLIPVYAVLMLATLYTHYTGLGALAAHVAIIGWTAFQTRSRAVIRRMATAGLLIALGFAPWLPVLLSRSGADRSYYAV